MIEYFSSKILRDHIKGLKLRCSPLLLRCRGTKELRGTQLKFICIFVPGALLFYCAAGVQKSAVLQDSNQIPLVPQRSFVPQRFPLLLHCQGTRLKFLWIHVPWRSSTAAAPWYLLCWPQLTAAIAGPVRIMLQFESFYAFPNLDLIF